MKKIIIAIKDDFIREAYSEIFTNNEFFVLETKSGSEVLSLTKQNEPNIIILDVDLLDLGGFKVLEKLRENKETEKIPVIIFTQVEKGQEREEALRLEAKDFIAATDVTLSEIIRRVKIILGEQKSYMIAIKKNLFEAKDLIADLGYSYSFKCEKCGSDLVLYLIRDLSKGERDFIVSVICPVCKK